jgi:hypothetical protein
MKLLGQCIGVAIVVFGAGITIHSITLTSRIELPPASRCRSPSSSCLA